MPHDVFVSYSGKDKAIADAAVAILDERGIQCWISPRNIPAGAEWGESIVRAIQESKVMVLILSANSNASTQVRHEVERADHYHVRILPVRIEDFQLSGNMEYHLPASQWLDATQTPFEQHLPHLADSVQYLLQQGPKPTPPPPVPRRKFPKLAIVLAALVLFGLGTAWWLYGYLADVDTALVGEWVNNDAIPSEPGSDFQQSMTLKRDGDFSDDVAAVTPAGTLRTVGQSRFASGEHDLTISLVGTNEISTSKFDSLPMTALLGSASLPLAGNVDYSLYTDNQDDPLAMMRAQSDPKNRILWKRQGNSGNGLVGDWGSKIDTGNLHWNVDLIIDRNFRVTIKRQARIVGKMIAKGGAFHLAGAKGVSDEGSYELHGSNVLILARSGSMPIQTQWTRRP